MVKLDECEYIRKLQRILLSLAEWYCKIKNLILVVKTLSKL